MIKDIIIADQIVYDVPEHQILLSFAEDSEAVDFYTWWHTEGYDLFKNREKETDEIKF